MEELLKQVVSSADGQNGWVLVLIALWSIPWKGYALWKSSQRKEKWWFIALLLVNTIGILEILYIFIFSKRKEIADEMAREKSE